MGLVNVLEINLLASNYDAKEGSACPISWWYSGISGQSDHIKIGGCDETTQG